MSGTSIIVALAEELALFAGAGFLLFALDDLAVDLIYIARRLWRGATVYSRFPRAFAQTLGAPATPGWLAVFIPAWDESAVIAPMLRTTLNRFGKGNYRLFVGHYPNDPSTGAAISLIDDPRVIAVELPHDGPTTKADCLNHLFAALRIEEARLGRSRAIVLHDAEDVVHPAELKIFETLIERVAALQLPVVPLPDPHSRWIAGHYGDEFAESHGKELVVREAVGAAVPLAGVGCAIRRDAIDRLAETNDGLPFEPESMTEDYEIGLRLGAMGLKTMFVRMPANPGDRSAVATRGHFPTTLDAAVRQKARWIGGIALSGWERLGWRGGLGERWMRMRDRRGPFAALLMVAGYAAALLWVQLALAHALGAPIAPSVGPKLMVLLQLNALLLTWRMLVRALFTTAAYGFWQGLLSVPRLLVANVIAILAVRRAITLHGTTGPRQWDKTSHIFPRELGA